MWTTLTFLSVMLLLSLSNKASGAAMSCEVNSYYSSITGLETGPPASREGWITLYESLHELLVQTHVIIPYTSSSTDVWDALQILDQDPSNPANVWLLYANRTEPFVTHGQSSGWNREHVIPRSYGLFDNGPDYSDLHNLRASDANVNSARSNLYFDNCEPDRDDTCQRPAHIEAESDTSKNSLKFYPSAYRKGDIARSAFYMALRYNGTGGLHGEANTEQIVLSECPCVDRHAFGNLSSLLEWAREDSVDAAEEARNNLACSLFQVVGDGEGE
jgi:endonuclease I